MGKGARAVLLVCIVATIFVLSLPTFTVMSWADEGRTDYREVAAVVAFLVVAIGVLLIGRSSDE